MGSICEWQLAHVAPVRCWRNFCRTDPVGTVSCGKGGTPGGGGGGSLQSSCPSTHLPRLTGLVPLFFDVIVRKLAWVKSPMRGAFPRLILAKPVAGAPV